MLESRNRSGSTESRNPENNGNKTEGKKESDGEGEMDSERGP